MTKTITYISFLFFLSTTFFALKVSANDADLCSDYFRILSGRGNKFENILGEKIEFETQKRYESLVQLSGFDKQYFISSTYGEMKFYALKGTFSSIQKAEEKMFEIQRKFSECLFDYKFKIANERSLGKTIYIQNPSDKNAQSKIELIIDETSQQYYVALIIQNHNYEIPANALLMNNNLFPTKIQRLLNTKFQDQLAIVIDSAYNNFDGLKIKKQINDSLNVFQCNCKLEGAQNIQINYADDAKFSAVFLVSNDNDKLEKMFEELKSEIEELIRYKYPLFKIEENIDFDSNLNSKTYIVANKTKIRIGIFPSNILHKSNDYEVRINIF